MRRAVPVLALSALLAAGCSDGGQVETSSTSDAGTPAVTATSSTPPATSTPAQDDDAGGAEPAFSDPGTAAEQPAEGNGLTVVDVRTGRHDGYDRVVFELAGDGTPGWRVRYDDDPRTQGRGAPVELAGDATLAVLVEGVGYPFDTGIDEYSGDDSPAPSLPQVRELQLGGVFEGQYDAFIGVAERAPFRVFALEDPARVVVDVQHTG